MSFNPDKTEIMIFCNRSVPENLDFSFNGKSVPITTSHKHLGVTFSNDAKWNTNLDNIKSSVSKHLNILRKLKYRLSRTNLDKLYLVYIRPLFEYACELWDNCGIGILLFKLFHIFIVEGIKESLVEDNLQKGKIIPYYILKKFKFPSLPSQR
jgi:hypothetical protein